MLVKKRNTSALEPLIEQDGEVRELTEEDFRQFRPTYEFPELVEILRKHGRPLLPESERKKRVTMYLDRDVIEALKKDGRGWQTRANATLRAALGLPN